MTAAASSYVDVHPPIPSHNTHTVLELQGMWNEWASDHCVKIHEESRGCPLEKFFMDLIGSFRFPIDVADPDFADGLLRDELGPEWKVKVNFMVNTNQLGPENPFFKKRARELMTSYLTFRNALMDQSNEAGLRRGVDSLLDLVWTYSGLQETLYKVEANLALPCPFLNQAPKNVTADGIVTYDLLSAENIDFWDLMISRSWCVDTSSEDRPRSYQPIVMAFETKADASNVNTRTGLHQLVMDMAAAVHHRISLGLEGSRDDLVYGLLHVGSNLRLYVGYTTERREPHKLDSPPDFIARDVIIHRTPLEWFIERPDEFIKSYLQLLEVARRCCKDFEALIQRTRERRGKLLYKEPLHKWRVARNDGRKGGKEGQNANTTTEETGYTGAADSDDPMVECEAERLASDVMAGKVLSGFMLTHVTLRAKALIEDKDSTEAERLKTRISTWLEAVECEICLERASGMVSEPSDSNFG